MKNKLCIYHANCADGFGAALAVKMLLDNHNDFDYHASNYGDTPPDVTGKEVIIVDFSYPRAVLIEMDHIADSLIVIDHHETAQERLKGLDFCHFDMSKSGAVLTWEYFSPVPVPSFLQYIQDRDLWRWELPQSKEFSAGLKAIPMEFNNWIIHFTDIGVDALIEIGSHILAYESKLIKKVIKGGFRLVNLCGYVVPIINTNVMISEIGNELSLNHPFAIMYFDLPDRRIFSLRSSKHNPDWAHVGTIASEFGGGGHKHSAGFFIEEGVIGTPGLMGFM